MPRILDYGELEEKDYFELGFKSGLEIHQQLKTQKKLFCRCPAGEYYEEYDAEVLRHMRPTLSELGEYDGTALMEFKTRKEIIYQLNKRNVCTYEMDDTPPFELNQEALDIALEVTLLLNCNIVGELHIARKQYLDGSIPAGFQRTTILGTDGWVPYKDRRIGIRQLGLEEDACREVSDRGHRRVYKTDRLSIPLIETVTYPDMRAPWEVAEVAELLRALARSTGNVRTGIGRARQDVNVSVEGGTRVEIKGVPRIPYIPRLTHFEALRQANLLELRTEIQGRGVTKDTLESTATEVSGILKSTAFSPIRRALERDWRVKAVRLVGFRGLLGFPLQPGRDFASEVSDRVRVIACLDELPNIVHSEMMDNPITLAEWKRIGAALRAKKEDAIVLVWGDVKDAETAVGEIVIRVREAASGIPNETRQAFPTGINGFERILPGPDRMYPDTDMPPVPVSEERIERARGRLPMPPWDRRAYFRKLGLSPEIIKDMVIDERLPLFRKAVESLSFDPTLAAVLLSQTLKSLKRKGFPVSTIGDEEILDLLVRYVRGEFAREAFPDILKRMSMGNLPAAEILANLGLVPLGDEDVREIIRIIEGVERNLDPQDQGKKFRYLMGVLMAELRGRFPGEKVASFLLGAMERGTNLS
ncbi:MAG: Glu-tRNA(Gln) amidotransferase subunit GatE [Candidatus Aminicenantes bacterium]|nr:Glu-tRNA(Gln) amidotransferase subunit GatE [Candidatus Aminicenantes bacterium]